MDDNFDEIDQLIADGLSGYVDVKNIAKKEERAAGKVILGGKYSATPTKQSAYEEALSLGMTAMNEVAGETLAAPIPDSAINREIHARLVEHFKGKQDHGLRSALVGMGLESPEAKQFTVRNESETELLNRTANRAADRAMEIISGRQLEAGYPLTQIRIAGGHGIGRATSNRNGMPEQIMYDNNMQVEGGLENNTRHEYRGRKAADTMKKKFFQYLASDVISSKEALKVLDTMEIISKLRPR